MTDIVWNHTACNSEWLQDHPEAGYNLKNSPHLRPAFELDDRLLNFSQELIDGVYGGEAMHCCETFDDLNKIMNIWINVAFPAVKLWEFYVVDVNAAKRAFSAAWDDTVSGSKSIDRIKYASRSLSSLSQKERADLLAADAIYCSKKDGSRFDKMLRMEVCLAFVFKFLSETGFNDSDPLTVFTTLVDEINLSFYKEYDTDVAVINDQVMSRIMYLRVADHGPKLGAITREYVTIQHIETHSLTHTLLDSRKQPKQPISTPTK